MMNVDGWCYGSKIKLVSKFLLDFFTNFDYIEP